MGKKDKKLEKLASKNFKGEDLKNFKIWYRNISGDGKSLNDLLIEKIKKNRTAMSDLKKTSSSLISGRNKEINLKLFFDRVEKCVERNHDKKVILVGHNFESYPLPNNLESMMWLDAVPEIITYKKNRLWKKL